MILLLYLFLLANTTYTCSYKVHIYCPNMYKSFTERVLNAYICCTIHSMITSEEIQTFKDHVNAHMLTNTSGIKPEKISVLLENICNKHMNKHSKDSKILLIPSYANIFDDEHFSNDENNNYIRHMRQTYGIRTGIKQCIYYFVLFARITREQKIVFLDFFYNLQKKIDLNADSSLICTTSDTWADWFNETIVKADDNKFAKHDRVHVSFKLDLSELAGLFVNELDIILQAWFSQCKNQESIKELEESFENAKNKILKSYSEKYCTDLSTIFTCKNLEKVAVGSSRFFLSDYRHALSHLHYKTDNFSSDITQLLESSFCKIIYEFEDEFRNNFIKLKNLLRESNDKGELKLAFLTVTRQVTHVF